MSESAEAVETTIEICSVYRTRIESHLQRENELRQHNFQLRETISNTESSCHDAVAANLRRYDQCKVRLVVIRLLWLESDSNETVLTLALFSLLADDDLTR